MTKATTLFAALLLTTLTASAEIRLPRIISDHAVLQREAPIHLWGWSGPNESITAKLHDQTIATQSNKYGEWSLWFLPEHAGGPYTLTLNGSSSITLNDILIGDVWFASGQSNMEMPLNGFPPGASIKDGPKEIAAATHPKIRLLLVDKTFSDVPLDDINETSKAGWTNCTPETAARFSAVAYFFGRELAARENVPIGLIDATWGGTPVDSWISLTGFGADASLMPAFASRARFAEQSRRTLDIVAAEKREDDDARAANQPLPKHPWHPEAASWMPSALFNGMVAPEARYSIKGAIWYQGESNSSPERAPLYAELMQTLITDWREQFQQGNFPFLYVQISSFNSPPEEWGELRDQQRRALILKDTAMAVTLDVGTPDNVHPPDKQTVGTRLALAARAIAYAEPIEYSGPLYRQTTTEGDSLRIWFDHAHGLNSKNQPLQGFEIAGEDQHFVAATAKIETNDQESVLVSSPTVKEPRYVRYAWPNVTSANLYNSANLPASTFTSIKPQETLVKP
jgi:sialate O-acetylesterase